MSLALTESELWLLSYYRSSEIAGSLLFGRLARTMKPGAVQHDMTKHFADEAQHAWLWTDCIAELGANPLAVGQAYQDRYLAAAGLPGNLMEVLALTQVFEVRVIGQYSRHAHAPGLDPVIARTLGRIMEDEKWHISWVRDALKRCEDEHGADGVAAALRRYREADADVYRETLHEHADRLVEVLGEGILS
jgi:hypothetical protein